MRKKVEKEIKDAMVNMKFIFSSPCLINANPDDSGQYSSCFIIDLRDNVESIFDAAAKMAKIFQKSGGAGVANISVLRPANSRVEKSNGYSCGPVEFMKIYNVIADTMTKANKSKRGALKINMDVWHPDIYEFINCKQKDGELSLMNISVSIYDEFMRAVEENKDWDLIFPDYENMDKDVYDKEWNGDIYTWKEKGYPIKVYRTIKARELKEYIDKASWNTGDPGINYQDTMNKYNMNKHLGIMIYTNPCNEFTNLPWTSCNLGSINLVEYVTEDGGFDFGAFVQQVIKSVRWLDDMITVNKLPLPEIQEMTNLIRPIGLGVMGFGTALYKMKIRYGNNPECISFINKLGMYLRDAAIQASRLLAEDRGVYPAWAGSEWCKQGIKIRNSNLISIAPNGTLSSLAGVSGGIEPEFALLYYRRTNNGNIYYVTNPIFEDTLKELGLYSEELLEKIAKNHGSCQGIEEIPEWVQKVFVTSHDISPEEHVDIVAEFQKYVDLSISKTINFPNNASVDDISNIIHRGWIKGCKGLTVYRDGCRSEQTLSTDIKDKKEEIKEKQPKELTATEKLIIAETEDICPMCGNKLHHVGGCIECTCGWGKCSL